MAEINKFDIQQIIISTEKNPVVSARAHKIGIPCLQGIENKKYALLNYCQENAIELQQVAYVGNDINDKEAMDIVRYKLCPLDAHESIEEISDHIMKSKGGDGVIKELLDLIIKQKGE